MKAFTDLKQSKKLAEFLPIESADGFYEAQINPFTNKWEDILFVGNEWASGEVVIPAWSIATLLNYIKDKCGYFELVYLSSTFDGRANRLKNVHRLSCDVYDVYENELIDACYEMILKLNELKLL